MFRCSYWEKMIKQTFLHCRGVKGTLALVLAEYWKQCMLFVFYWNQSSIVFALKMPIQRSVCPVHTVLKVLILWIRGEMDLNCLTLGSPIRGEKHRENFTRSFNECLWRESTECCVQWPVMVSFGSEWTHQSNSQSAKAPILMKYKQAGNERVSVSDGAAERSTIGGSEKGPQNWHMLFVLLLTLGKGERYKERNTEKIRMTERKRETLNNKNLSAVHISSTNKYWRYLKIKKKHLFESTEMSRVITLFSSMNHLMRKTHFTNNHKHVHLKIMINNMTENLLEISVLIG